MNHINTDAMTCNRHFQPDRQIIKIAVSSNMTCVQFYIAFNMKVIAIQEKYKLKNKLACHEAVY